MTRAILIALRLFLLALLLLYPLARAQAHDEWISRGGHRNAAGEWCCGEGDCAVIEGATIGITDRGYKLSPSETVPYREAQPSPDGKFGSGSV